jgi:hypothetical protein
MKLRTIPIENKLLARRISLYQPEGLKSVIDSKPAQWNVIPYTISLRTYEVAKTISITAITPFHHCAK